MVSKIDTAEAFAPIDQLQLDITVLAIVFATGVGFFGVIASRKIANPLIKLKDLAVKISEGDFDSILFTIVNLIFSTKMVQAFSELNYNKFLKIKASRKVKIIIYNISLTKIW